MRARNTPEAEQKATQGRHLGREVHKTQKPLAIFIQTTFSNHIL